MALNFARATIAILLAVFALPAPVTAQTVNTVYFRNDCSLSMKFAAHYVTPFDREVTSDIRTIEPGETIEGVKTREGTYSYVAFDRHREWYGETYREVYVPARRTFIPLPFRERTINAETSTQVINCKDTYGDDAKIQPRVYLSCDSVGPVYFAMRYKALDGEWKTFSWSKVEGRAQVSLPMTWNSIIYLFARLDANEDGSIDGWAGEDAEFEIKGRSYGFKKYTLTDETMIGYGC